MSGTPEDRTTLERILDPDSVAVVGASTDPMKRGYQAIADAIEQGYRGEVYPVNPKYDEILGLEVYDSVGDVPGRVDLAFVTTPAPTVPGIVEACGAAGVAGVVVFSAGFGEDGNEDLQADLIEAARRSGVRLLGPNIWGIRIAHANLDLLGGYPMPDGSVALLTQSGNFGLDLGEQAAVAGTVGFSYNVGIGNELDLQFHEFLPYLRGDDHTDVVAIYTEGMADGRAFLRAASEAGRDKPVVVLKGGKTAAGKRSAQSHTASLAGQAGVVDAVYEQAGVVRADRTDELLAVCEALSRSIPASGENVAILTDGGGHATMAIDRLVDAGLSVPELDDRTQERLQERVPVAATVSNPVDVMGHASDLARFGDCAEILLANDDVDAVLTVGSFCVYGTLDHTDSEVSEAEVARRMARLSDEHDKPVVVHSYYEHRDSDAVAALREGGVPVYGSLDVAVTALSALADYGTHLEVADEKSDFRDLPDRRPAGSESGDSEPGDFRTERLSEYDARTMLADAGLDVAPFELARTAEEAVQAAAEFDEPAALKVVSTDIGHKSDVGGVRLDVEGADAVRAAYEDIVERVAANVPGADVDGVLVSPMVEAGVETIVGIAEDSEVGPVAMFGLGGVFVEVLEDVAFRGLPLTERDARELLADVDGRAVLEGARDTEPVDVDALVETLIGVSELYASRPEIVELDLNPVVASPDGATVVDANVVVRSR